jgi:endonuclease I
LPRVHPAVTNTPDVRASVLRWFFLALACLFGGIVPACADVLTRSNLHVQIRAGHQALPYSSSTRFDTADALAQIDLLPEVPGRVRLVYGGSLPTSSFAAATGWNREHLWPNSLGIDDRLPAYSDLHNLRPCDANVNSARGNKWFDVSLPTDPGYAKPAHAESPLSATDRDSWMPPASERGDLARALFYMDVRYEGTGGEPDLRLVEDTRLITSTGTAMGRLSTLLRWHAEDPPDAVERLRNEAVARLQGNRNPFVDEPALAAALYLPRLEIILTEGRPALTWDSELPLVLESAPAPSGPWSRAQAIPSAEDALDSVRLFRLTLVP